jgi:hypothetical protein
VPRPGEVERSAKKIQIIKYICCRYLCILKYSRV